MYKNGFTIIIDCFSLQQIHDSGECFRMYPADDGTFRVIAGSRQVYLHQSGSSVTFSCPRKEYDEFWKHYFDLDTDYRSIINGIDSDDAYLTAAARSGSGIRILNQDVWEMIVTFIISQQNNIKRIRKCIDTLCNAYGTDCGDYYAFPAPAQLAAATEEELRAHGLGYRSRYLAKTARAVADGEINLEQLRTMDYPAAKEELLKLSGIGTKVADCICLFALHHLNAFPVDTHIRQVLDANYPAGFPFERYPGICGVVQQYMFYYDLNRLSRQ